MKVAFIGCGSITKQRHAYEYSLRKDVEIAGFFDFVAKRSEDLVKNHILHRVGEKPRLKA